MLKTIFIIILIIIAAVAAYLFYFLNTPQFGRTPTGQRAEIIAKSPNFKDGHFVEKEKIVNHLKGNFITSMYDFLFASHPELSPKEEVIHQIPNIKELDPNKDLIIWLGHSSFYLQIDGKKILVDPIFSGNAAPVSFMIKSFKGTEVVKAEDFENLDAILISHDHWDHLDYPTITKLNGKTKAVVAGLGVGEYFEYWGYKKEIVHDVDYGTEVKIDDNLSIRVLPSHHFSGRLFTPNPTEPCSFAITTPNHKIFYSGDSGYGSHFKEIGDEYGPFDFAIMEDGQYDEQWHNVHMMPEEAVKAAIEVKASAIMPVHNSKFVLANHAWEDPLQRIIKAANEANLKITTPMIGQVVYLDNLDLNTHWFEKQK